ncbi:hypothetical protein KQY30_13745 [Streptomyces sp. GMY02]|uniref:hypothetical protein n=1 Tax=Streptomyces sp. GMY02 TaxID=1333528 RepID=UPI001C2BDB2F|nr:hypothetical protein [Streptomyces sp. GMY02]QXE35172.1 hypothetical protein KQY30_13745 [Streptomyces sp. GMY02]
MTVAVMWEAKAAPGRGAELLAWARSQPLPHTPLRQDLLRAPEDRVLIITWWPAPHAHQPPELPDPPPHLTARPVHRWRFEAVE